MGRSWVSEIGTHPNCFNILESGAKLANPAVVLRDLPLSDRPRERLLRHGASALSDVELLALLVSPGTARCDAVRAASGLLGRFPDLHRMAVAGIGELAAVPGLGVAKACRVKAALALAERLVERPVARGAELTDPRTVYERIGRRLVHLDRERFVGVALDTRGRVLRELCFAEGGGCSVEFQPRDVFATLLREGAMQVIFVHNHPSGDPEPSEADRRLTRRLRRAGLLVGVRVLDHVVVARGGYRSIVHTRSSVGA